MSLLSELTRRRAIRVLIAYVAVSWVVLQVADVVFSAIPLPDWSMRFLLVVVVLGFPVAMLLAWIFQVDAEGAVKWDTSRLPYVQLAGLGAAALLLGSALAFLWSELRSSNTETQHASPPRVAVMPLRDMSPGGDKAYFSDGIQEELISRLSEIRHLAVTSRTSVDRYRNTNQSVPQIAQQLGVQYILEGSVRHSGNRVRITLQFIDAQADEHLWVRDFDETLSMDKLFEIQSDVSKNIAALLRTQLTPGELERLARLPTQSIAAYEAYLKGIHRYRRYNQQDLRLSIEHLRRATEIDPQFSNAWSGLANSYMLAATTYGWLQPSVAIEYAKEYGAKALELNQYDGSILSLVGDIAYWYDYDAISAEAKYLEGIAVDPYHIGNRLSYAYLLSTQGRFDEAIEQVEYWLAKEPRAAHLHTNAAWRYFDARRYEQAIKHADIALLLNPGMDDALNAKTYSLILSNRLEEAKPLVQDSWVRNALWLMRSGHPQQARAYVESLAESAPQAGHAALLYAVVGDTDTAIKFINQAIDEHNREALLIRTWEVFDPMRTDPRFQSALRRMGFTPE